MTKSTIAEILALFTFPFFLNEGIHFESPESVVTWRNVN